MNDEEVEIKLSLSFSSAESYVQVSKDGETLGCHILSGPAQTAMKKLLTHLSQASGENLQKPGKHPYGGRA